MSMLGKTIPVSDLSRQGRGYPALKARTGAKPRNAEEGEGGMPGGARVPEADRL